MSDAANLLTTFVIVDKQQRAETMDVTDTFWTDLDNKYGDFAGRLRCRAAKHLAHGQGARANDDDVRHPGSGYREPRDARIP